MPIHLYPNSCSGYRLLGEKVKALLNSFISLPVSPCVFHLAIVFSSYSVNEKYAETISIAAIPPKWYIVINEDVQLKNGIVKL